MATLTLMFKEKAQATYPLDRNKVVRIGRLAENDIIIDNTAVSGVHAQLTADQFGFMLQDLGSRNGTFISGNPIKSRRLNHGDLITIGKHELLFTDEDETATLDLRQMGGGHTPAPGSSDQRTAILDTRTHQELLHKTMRASNRKPLLVITCKDKLLYKHILKKDKTTIGRSASNDIVLDNPAVSLEHALIARDQEGFELRDVTSKNGTFVNKTLTTSCRLHSGDIITIGKHELTFESEGTFTLEEAFLPATSAAIPSECRTTVIDTKASRQLQKRNLLHQGGAVLAFVKGGSGEVPITAPAIKIGKGAHSDIIVSGFLVGETAALVTVQPDGYYLCANEGLIKPTLNGRKVSKQVKLADRDLIAIGSVILRFRL